MRSPRAPAVLLAAVATVATLGLCEAVFRTFLVEPVVPRTEPEFAKRIASTWPRPVAVARASDTFRIVGLADSFGQAGWMRNYHYLLEADLRAWGIPAEVVNVSAPAFQPSDEGLALERFGLRYRPDLVLHGFFVGNDFATADGDLVEFRGIVMRRTAGIASWLPGRLLLVQWLRHYQLVLRDRVRTLLRAAAVPPSAVAAVAPGESRRREAAIAPFSEGEFLRIERQRLDVLRRRSPEAWASEPVFAILDDIRRAVEQSGARYVLVIHPDQLQVEVTLQEQLSEAFDLDLERDFDPDGPQKALLSYCASRGIPCLDLLPRFRAEGALGGLFLLRNTHYNDAGNRLAAAAIAAFLRERKLVPDGSP